MISWYEEYLEHTLLGQHKDAHVKLLAPSITSILFLDTNMAMIKDAMGDLKGVSHIFLPINDNRDTQRAEGGTHWSLLVVSINDQTAFHYDSLMSTNFDEARMIAKKLGQMLDVPLKFMDLQDAPQQDNGTDCGVFVIMNMRTLLERLLSRDRGEQVSMSLKNAKLNSTRERKDLLNKIKELRKHAEQTWEKP